MSSPHRHRKCDNWSPPGQIDDGRRLAQLICLPDPPQAASPRVYYAQDNPTAVDYPAVMIVGQLSPSTVTAKLVAKFLKRSTAWLRLEVVQHGRRSQHGG